MIIFLVEKIVARQILGLIGDACRVRARPRDGLRTVRTGDGCPSAHYEHTIVITRENQSF